MHDIILWRYTVVDMNVKRGYNRRGIWYTYSLVATFFHVDWYLKDAIIFYHLSVTSDTVQIMTAVSGLSVAFGSPSSGVIIKNVSTTGEILTSNNTSRTSDPPKTMWPTPPARQRYFFEFVGIFRNSTRNIIPMRNIALGAGSCLPIVNPRH